MDNQHGVSMDWKPLSTRFSVLSRRELEVANLIVEGLTNKEIVEKLFIDMKTVKYHNTAIFKKLGAKDRYAVLTLHYEEQIARLQSEIANLRGMGLARGAS